MKRELSSQTPNTISNIAKKNHDFQENLSSNSDFNSSYYTKSHHSNVISRLTSNLPKWDGLCVLTENHINFAYNRLKIVNTCSIDYFLLTFWVSKILDQNIINILEEHRNSVRYLTLKCQHCTEILFIRFTLTPPWLLIAAEYKESKGHIYFENLPKIFCIDNQNFQLLYATVGSMNSYAHFKSYYTLDNRCFMINDIGPTIVEVVPGEEPVSFCFYFNNKD